MARLPHPWFWEERAEWCVNLNGQRQKLGSHPDGFPAPKKIKGKWNAPLPIMQEFHKLMAKTMLASPSGTEGEESLRFRTLPSTAASVNRNRKIQDLYWLILFMPSSRTLWRTAQVAAPELKPFIIERVYLLLVPLWSTRSAEGQ